MNAWAIFAVAAALNWTMPDGKVVTETRELAPFADGVTLSVSREKFLSMKAKRLDIIPSFAHAKKGESGFWFSSYGVYGEYDCDNGRYFAGSERMSMPMFGWSNPRGAWLAIVTSMKYFVRESVVAKNGEYTVAGTIEESLCRNPYEDLVIEYHKRPADTTYVDLAKIYRKYQIDRGEVKPFRERFAENKVLEKAILAPDRRRGASQA